MSATIDLDAFVKNYHLPLQLVRRVDHFSIDDWGVTLRCQTRRFQREYRDRYGTWVEIGEEDGNGEPATIRVEFCTPHIYRFRMTPRDDIPENRTPMVINDFADRQFSLTIQETDDQIILTSEALTVILQLDPWQITVTLSDGSPLFRSLPAAMFQHPPTGMHSIDGANISDAWPWFFRGLYPLGFIKDEENGMIQTFETAVVHHDDHFYGFGEKFSTLDKRGQAISMWHTNATGNTWIESYKNVPFFSCSNGYGIFINTAYPVRYHMGDYSHTRYSMHLQHDVFDYYFIEGDLKEILLRYINITGQPALPPLWSFGLWMSRMSYREQETVESVAARLRSEDIPCDVIHIDTDWFARPWVNDLTFSSERFPDPAGMIARLREQGFHLTLWQIPYIGTESAFYQEGVDNGYFAQQDDGTPRHIQGFFGKAAVVDYSNPQAVEWMYTKLQPLFDMGGGGYQD